MNHSNIVNIIRFCIKALLFVSGTFVFVVSNVALAQVNRTGSHLNSNTVTSVIVQLNDPSEVKHIRELLDAGRDEKALEAARTYVEQTNTALYETLARYYAYNALCTVLTSVGQLTQAIENCTIAMPLAPDKWSAVNNRGTAKLLAGMYTEALEDYRLALSLIPSGEKGVIGNIQHNISLVEERSSRN